MTSLTDPALAYRNAIVTLLIERPTMRRGEIRAELCPSGDPIQLHRRPATANDGRRWRIEQRA
jgi:hypothetical protein